ncbi:MAG: DUF2490 domain-containing protein [Legionellaceae bacterium]|nr:DUF2490 domain-containing protein [Legionellaceae bacterium]MBP9775546.1 DUF2490 domain-containing protein [Legionellaceae bacterium]
MYITRLGIAGVLSLISQLVFSESYTKLWGLASYFGQYEQLLYAVEPQIRLVDSAGTYEQSLLNAGIGTTIKPQLQIWLGQTYTNYSDNNNVAEDVENVVSNEYRVWEQIMWRRPFSDEFASRLRVEQRRAFQTSEWAVRLRERAYWTIPVNEMISFALNDEIFLNLKSVPWVATSTFDQNRVFVGIYYKFTPNIGLNVSYMNQYIARDPVEVNNGLVLNLIAYMY